MNTASSAAPGAGRVAANAAPAGLAVPDALPFQLWIALDGALPAVDTSTPVDGAAPDAIPEDPAIEAPDDAPMVDQAVVIDTALAAMVPPTLSPVAAAALPAVMMALPGARPQAADDGVTAPGTASAPAPGIEVVPPAVSLGATAPSIPLPATPAPAAALHDAPGAPAARMALETARADGADTVPTTATAGIGIGPSQGTPTRGADNVTLAGPPTAWRQSLQEALGERLQLQLGRGLEQATIRLEPPQLGRIEISVRHSSGNLEVHIAASNGEVLRQLNTVSDSLRGDLAGRQYVSVALSVGETPRAQASAQAGNGAAGQPDAQGRGRQQAQEEQRQRTPGLALDEAHDAGSPFTIA